MLVNGCLAFTIHHFDRSAGDHLEKCLNNFYNNEAIVTAKRALWEECSSHLGTIPTRQDSVNRTAKYANILDIVEAIKKLDQDGKLPEVYVKDLDTIPDRQPEELNYYWLIQRVAKLDQYRVENEKICAKIATDIVNLQESDREIRGDISQIRENNQNEPIDETSNEAAPAIASETENQQQQQQPQEQQPQGRQHQQQQQQQRRQQSRQQHERQPQRQQYQRSFRQRQERPQYRPTLREWQQQFNSRRNQITEG